VCPKAATRVRRKKRRRRGIVVENRPEKHFSPAGAQHPAGDAAPHEAWEHMGGRRGTTKMPRLRRWDGHRPRLNQLPCVPRGWRLKRLLGNSCEHPPKFVVIPGIARPSSATAAGNARRLNPERCGRSGWNGQPGRSRRQLAAESSARRWLTIGCAVSAGHAAHWILRRPVHPPAQASAMSPATPTTLHSSQSDRGPSLSVSLCLRCANHAPSAPGLPPPPPMASQTNRPPAPTQTLPPDPWSYLPTKSSPSSPPSQTFRK